MINAVKALCVKHGVEQVAQRARVSADNLRLIIDGRKLPSGAPRGVGPTLQHKLEIAYPGWADAPKRPGNKFEDRHEVDHSDWATLQAVKAFIPENDLADMRDRYAKVKADVAADLASIARHGKDHSS